MVKYGLVNAFTCIGRHDTTDSSSFSRIANNVSFVTGVLTHTVTLDDDTEALVAYLAGPQGTVIGWSQGLLLPQCPGGITGTNQPNTGTCSYNTFDPQSRWGTRRSDTAGSVASAPSFHSSADAYWRQFSSLVKLSSADQPNAAWSLRQQTPAFETFVSACAAADCSGAKPIQNFYSPVSWLPPIIEVAVTAKTRNSVLDSTHPPGKGWYGPVSAAFPATTPPLSLQTFDYDGFLTAVYNPAFDGSTRQNFSAEVFTGTSEGPLMACFGGSLAGKVCSASSDCGSGGSCRASWQSQVCLGGPWAGQSCSDQTPAAGACGANGTCASNWNFGRLVFDFDRNLYNGAGAFFKFDFSWLDPATVAAVQAADRNLTVPLWPRRFTQHVLGTVDQPFIDVDNPNAAGGVDARGDHIRYPRASGPGLWWSSGGSAYSQLIFSSFGCDAGSANQPPQFVASLLALPQSRAPPQTSFSCYWNKPCTVTVYAADFALSADGVDSGVVSSDRVGIELAVGSSQAENDSQLTEVDANGVPVNPSITGCTGPLAGLSGSGTGKRGCRLTIGISATNPAGDIGKILVKCFTAFDTAGGSAAWTTGGARTCRSLPLCVKVRIEGQPPAFVAPTPGFDSAGLPAPPYSRDDFGQYVSGRTDVPACLGYPVSLVLAAVDPDGQNTRIFAYDPDVDQGLYGAAAYPYLAEGGRYNPDFFQGQLGAGFPPECGPLVGYGAQRAGNNSQQTSIAAMLPVGGVKSVMSAYLDQVQSYPNGTSQAIVFSPSLALRNGAALRSAASCGPQGTGSAFPSCGEVQVNMDQVVCAFAYDDSRRQTGRWAGARDPNGDDVPSWRRDHSNGDYASPQHCWRVTMQAPPAFVSDAAGGCSPGQCYATPFAADWLAGLLGPGGPQGSWRHLRVAVGAPFSVTLIAQDPNAQDAVAITILQDTGVPLNTRVGQSTCLARGAGRGMCASVDATDPATYLSSDLREGLNTAAPSPCSRASLTLSWTPGPLEAGMSFRVCAVARDDSVACSGIAAGSTGRGWYGSPLCYVLEVVRADVFWVNAYDSFNSAEAYVGCRGVLQATAADRSDNPLASRPGTGNYPLIVNVSGAMPPGAAPGPFVGPATTASQSVVWLPQHGSEGLRYQVCFTVSDTYSATLGVVLDGYCDSDSRACAVARLGSDCRGAQRCRPACSTLQVARCRYCVSPGDTLGAIMRRVALDSNWLRLWALNGNEDMETNALGVVDPDRLSQATVAPVSVVSARALVSDGLPVPMARPLPNPQFLGGGVIVNISAEADAGADPQGPGPATERRRVYVGVTYRVKVAAAPGYTMSLVSWFGMRLGPGPREHSRSMAGCVC